MTPSPFRSKSVRVTVVLAVIALVILLFTNPSKPAWPAPICEPGPTAAAHC
jgi:hypothetical protein